MPAKKDEVLPGSNSYIAPKMDAREKQAIQSDPATHLATHRGQQIEIFHVPTGQSIVFKAYIDDFQDKYDSDWQSTDVYGRMDPIHQYQGTKRVISLDWIVPSYSIAEAKHNHEKCALLFSMLYPFYNTGGSQAPSSATQISTAPIFKVKFGNLIQDPRFEEGGGDVEETGLVGAISGFTYAPNIEAGFVDVQGNERDVGPIQFPRQQSSTYVEGFVGQMYPKEVKLSMEYTVFHTNPLGWSASEGKRTPGFPYGGEGASSSGDTGNGAVAGANAAGNMAERDEAAEQEVLGQ